MVMCPGSRNAPLMQVFHSDPAFTCHSIVDERSAGYVALGMARETGEPVAVVTTSGTATLNLAPAVAEAFFQQVPLVILTADRPEEFPPQFTNQRIHQSEIYTGHVKAAFQLPADLDTRTTPDHVVRQMSAVIVQATSGAHGPVHLNIPLEEPLYEPVAKKCSPAAEIFTRALPAGHEAVLTQEDKVLIDRAIRERKKVLIVAGVHRYSDGEIAMLTGLTQNYEVAVIAENLANLPADQFVVMPELLLAGAEPAGLRGLLPDLVITTGGAVVSKRTRLFVQGLKNVPVIATGSLPGTLFREIPGADPESEHSMNQYLSAWKTLEKAALERSAVFFRDAAFSNLSACRTILENLPKGSSVHLGNSATVRYSQLLPVRSGLTYYSNRGTSGIDGSLSTAVGAAMVSDRQHVVIMGDLSFVYDSNGMWNAGFPDNLKVVVLNDHGGGIFRLLDGPGHMSFFEEFSVTNHPVDLQLLVRAFGLDYRQAKDIASLQKGLRELFTGMEHPGVLEVDTAGSENSFIFKQFFKFLQYQENGKT